MSTEPHKSLTTYANVTQHPNYMFHSGEYEDPLKLQKERARKIKEKQLKKHQATCAKNRAKRKAKRK